MGLGFVLLLVLPLVIIGSYVLFQRCTGRKSASTPHEEVAVDKVGEQPSAIVALSPAGGRWARKWLGLKAVAYRLRWWLIVVEVVAVLWLLASGTALTLMKTCAVNPVPVQK